MLDNIISFEELGVVLCNSKSRKKLTRPMFAKICYEYIPVFYKKFGYIFRNSDNPKQYYSMEEMQKLFKNHVKKSIEL